MIKENCKLALISIKANKMRAFLTMLGIIIGVAAVIAIMTVGNSMTKSVQKQLESYGVQNIDVGITAIDWSLDVTTDDEENMKLSTDTIHDIATHFKSEIAAISVESSAGSGSVLYNNKSANVEVTGVSLGYFKANNLKLIQGSYFSESAYTQGSLSAIVSDRFAKQLAGNDYSTEDILGREFEVNINDEYMTVTPVGIYEYKATGSSYGTTKSVTTTMYIPLKAAQDFTHNTDIYSIEAVAADGVDASSLATEIQTYLTEKKSAQLGDNLTVEAYSNQSMIEENTKTLTQITMAISLIAAIALIVGGIGVMNIMTVSITERTREIGTRKALGAQDGMIMMQFICEAVIICLIGGIIGIIVGLILGYVGAHFMGFAPTVSFASIYMSVGFSMAIGVFFGYSPARHAANMNPIDALRYE